MTAVILVLVAGCTPAGQAGAEKLMVVATIYPLEYFTAQIGGDGIQMVGLVPAGVAAHYWEPGPQHLVTIEKAAVFVHNGAGFEPWVGRVLGGLQSQKLIVVAATEGLELLNAEGRAQGQPDPHVWLDPLRARGQVAIIRDALIQADPHNKDTYQANAQKLTQRLDELHRSFDEGLSQCRRRDITVAHNAFNYLAKRYNLRVHPIAGVSPDVEPSPSQLAELVEEAREHGTSYIFFETLVNPALAQTVAKEIGAETLVLNPLQGLTKEEVLAGEDYFTIMEKNLKNLQTALEC